MHHKVYILEDYYIPSIALTLKYLNVKYPLWRQAGIYSTNHMEVFGFSPAMPPNISRSSLLVGPRATKVGPLLYSRLNAVDDSLVKLQHSVTWPSHYPLKASSRPVESSPQVWRTYPRPTKQP